MPFRLRPARRGDAEQIRAMLAELGHAKPADPATVNWIISHPEMELFVATDSFDKAVGVLALSHRPQLRFSARAATIDELVVTPSWRRRGVGRELLRRAIERAKVLVVKQLEIQGPTGDAGAREFLRACGFTDGPDSIHRLGGI